MSGPDHTTTTHDAAQTAGCPHGLGRRYRRIGSIARLQLQSSSLIVQTNGRRSYDPAPLVDVESLVLSTDGLVSGTDDTMVDAHHRSRRLDRPWKPDRVVSFGFLGSYRSLRGHFPGLADGAAGENLLIAHDADVTFRDLAGGVHICGPRGGGDIDCVRPMDPCPPFVRYVLGNAADKPAVRRALPRFRNGMRGYGGRPADGPFEVRRGDDIWVRRSIGPVVRERARVVYAAARRNLRRSIAPRR